MRRYQRGDTIIEVLLAFAVFAFLAVGTTVVMNRGLSMGQQSLERTLVRQQVDAQAELLRYARDTDPGTWQQIIDESNLTTNPSQSLETCPASAPGRSFILSASTGFGLSSVRVYRLNSMWYTPASYYSRAVLDTTTWGSGPVAHGIWIQAVKVQGGASSEVTAYDMYIRACWDSVGTSRPLQVSTIVRLYEN